MVVSPAPPAVDALPAMVAPAVPAVLLEVEPASQAEAVKTSALAPKARGRTRTVVKRDRSTHGLAPEARGKARALIRVMVDNAPFGLLRLLSGGSAP